MFNTEEIYTLVGAELMRRRGCEFGEELKDAIMGLRPQPTFETMIRWHGLEETWEEMAAESNRIFVALLDEHLAPLPGLLELIAWLEKEEIPKAIGTSSGRDLLEELFRRFDLQNRFQFILTAEDITRGKPHPEIYLTAAERFGLDPQQMLVLEDSQNGCRAAAAAGAFTVAVPGEHSRRHDFTAASLVVESLAAPRLYEVLKIGSR